MVSIKHFVDIGYRGEVADSTAVVDKVLVEDLALEEGARVERDVVGRFAGDLDDFKRHL